MPTYIEREALQVQLVNQKPKPANARYTEGFNDALLQFRSMVSAASPADVAPVMRGEWVPEGHLGFLVCSACHNCYVVEDWLEGGKWNFCPNCGATMKGEEGEDHDTY